MMTRKPGFKQIGHRRFGRATCFLCRCRLTEDNRTVEHVIPRWVQSRYGLWDQTLVLLNGTTIPYRQLTVPCCRECNNKHLEPLESSILSVVSRGPDAVEALDRKVLFLWLGKMFFGLLYKESLIPLDRRRPGRGTIVPKVLLSRFMAHHRFLQAARIAVNFIDFFPASIFVYELQEPPEPGRNFNFGDNFRAMTISVQLGRVGILAALQDGGALEIGFGDYLGRYRRLQVHPLQFLELTAMVVYKSLLMNRVPKYIMVEQPDGLGVIQMPLAGYSSKPVFDDWDSETYAKVFAALSGIPFEHIYISPQVRTYLNGEDGQPTFLDLTLNPWP